MHVVATAGHVDHGKSTLIEALTGQQPDRLVHERERGLSIELGYCWTKLPKAGDVAFVDVPGHERFLSTMLAGVGPVPTVLFIVAADDPWMPQAAEHLAVLDALKIRQGLLVVTRRDLTDPGPALDRARTELARTSLADVPAVVVSALTGEGLDQLRELLDNVLLAAEGPTDSGGVRLWVDRVFTRPGAGQIVTGTLPAGRITAGDRLLSEGRLVQVRGLQSLGRPVDSVTGLARVSVRLGSGAPPSLTRGSTLTTPGAWCHSAVLDVRIDHAGEPLPSQPMIHVGASSVPSRLRVLVDANPHNHDPHQHEHVTIARLTMAHEMPWHIGDRILLRDPGRRLVWGATVLDPLPTPLRRRGDGRRRGAELLMREPVPSAEAEVRRRGIVSRDLLRKLGVATDDVVGLSESAEVSIFGNWLVHDSALTTRRTTLVELLEARTRTDPLQPGMSVGEAVRALDLPDERLLSLCLTDSQRLADGRVHAEGDALPSQVAAALDTLAERLRGHPFDAPDAPALEALNLDHRALAAAARAGRLLRLSETVVLLAGADAQAAERLRDLPQPFTTSEARQALDTTRRVMIPLLDHLDRLGMTRRLPDDRREVVSGRV